VFDAGGGELGGGLVDEGDVAAEDAGEDLDLLGAGEQLLARQRVGLPDKAD
jgi:hypothetical protein